MYHTWPLAPNDARAGGLPALGGGAELDAARKRKGAGASGSGAEDAGQEWRGLIVVDGQFVGDELAAGADILDVRVDVSGVQYRLFDVLKAGLGPG